MPKSFEDEVGIIHVLEDESHNQHVKPFPSVERFEIGFDDLQRLEGILCFELFDDDR